MNAPIIFRGLLPRRTLLVAVAMAMAAPVFSVAAESQPITLPNTYTGVYETLANLAMEALHKGDYERAALQAKILETVWDRAEAGMKLKSRDTWSEIDDALDGFIKPIVRYGDEKPDPAAVEAAYGELMAKLKLAHRT